MLHFCFIYDEMTLHPLTTDQITDRLRQENPWRATGKVDEDYLQMQRRLYFDLFYPMTVNLMGTRRVEKTVKLHHSIDILIKSGVHPHQTAYIVLCISEGRYFQY